MRACGVSGGAEQSGGPCSGLGQWNGGSRTYAEAATGPWSKAMLAVVAAHGAAAVQGGPRAERQWEEKVTVELSGAGQTWWGAVVEKGRQQCRASGREERVHSSSNHGQKRMWFLLCTVFKEACQELHNQWDTYIHGRNTPLAIWYVHQNQPNPVYRKQGQKLKRMWRSTGPSVIDSFCKLRKSDTVTEWQRAQKRPG